MSSYAGVLTGAIVAAGIALVWWLSGQDTGATVEFFAGNWSVVVLAAQIVICFILAVCGRTLSGFVLLLTVLVTIMGMLVVRWTRRMP